MPCLAFNTFRLTFFNIENFGIREKIYIFAQKI